MTAPDRKPDTEPAGLAPLPDTNKIRDALWQHQWKRFGHLTTPLRARGLVCDVELGELWLVRAQLPDKTHLLISGPADGGPGQDAAHPPGWLVTHRADDNGTLYGVPYDSCPEAPHAAYGPRIEPMLDRIDAYCRELGIDLPRPAQARESAPPPALTLTGCLPTAVLSTEEAETVFRAAARVPFRPSKLGWVASVPVGDHHYEVAVAGPYPPRIFARRGPHGTDHINCRATPEEEDLIRHHVERLARAAGRAAPQPGTGPAPPRPGRSR
ncbi:hypothetical protein ABZ569_10725 [Streptomyces albus]|uniref:hypothetical protein n=1 Tax=Streptomyces albus TaxID=1888 RepID=UPI0033D14D17